MSKPGSKSSIKPCENTVKRMFKLLQGKRCKFLHQRLVTLIILISSLYVCMAIKYIIVLFVETPRKFITAKLSIRKPESSSVLIICDLFKIHTPFLYTKVEITTLLYIKRACELNKSHISTDEDPGLRIESFAVINLRGVSTNKTIILIILSITLVLS